ncbi:MAG: N-methyl-L-tryptophan oxidase [Thermomicrobiales bacterium]
MRSAATYDVIVIGVGGMGSAACAALAQRGKRVLGLERFDIPHAMGSSHGVNRIIRLAYYEDPSYVPLLRRAYELWRELESGFGEQLLYITGSIDASDRDGEIFRDSLKSCEIHNLPHEILTSKQLRDRFPAYHLPENHLALLQPEGGFLASERCIVANVVSAIEEGARIHAREAVQTWRTTTSGVRVETDRGVHEAELLVISAGAWAGELIPELALLAQPERQVLAWLQPGLPELFCPDRFPVFNVTVEEGRYYGFPIYSIPGFKVGRYHHLQEHVDPDTMEREPNDVDEAMLRTFAGRYFPGSDGPTMALKACMFTNSPDEHFIIDVLPRASNVLLVSPCSGHGFKFCSVIGEIVADLVSTGSTDHDISLFKLDRFAEDINQPSPAP